MNKLEYDWKPARNIGTIRRTIRRMVEPMKCKCCGAQCVKVETGCFCEYCGVIYTKKIKRKKEDTFSDCYINEKFVDAILDFSGDVVYSHHNMFINTRHEKVGQGNNPNSRRVLIQDCLFRDCVIKASVFVSDGCHFFNENVVEVS